MFQTVLTLTAVFFAFSTHAFAEEGKKELNTFEQRARALCAAHGAAHLPFTKYGSGKEIDTFEMCLDEAKQADKDGRTDSQLVYLACTAPVFRLPTVGVYASTHGDTIVVPVFSSVSNCFENALPFFSHESVIKGSVSVCGNDEGVGKSTEGDVNSMVRARCYTKTYLQAFKGALNASSFNAPLEGLTPIPEIDFKLTSPKL